MSDVDDTKFVIADPDGVFLTLTEREARAFVAEFADDDDPSPAMLSLVVQLQEWFR